MIGSSVKDFGSFCQKPLEANLSPDNQSGLHTITRKVVQLVMLFLLWCSPINNVFWIKSFQKIQIILDIENKLTLKVRLCHFLSTLPRKQEISFQFWPTIDGQSLYNQKSRPRSLKGRLSNRAFIHQWGQQNGGNKSEIAFEAASGSFDQNYYHSNIGNPVPSSMLELLASKATVHGTTSGM